MRAALRLSGKAAALLAALALPARAQRGLSWAPSLKEASAQASKEGRLLLVDFQAVWCYSCYYMEQKVLDQPAFALAAADLALVKLDVDKQEGEELRKRYQVQFLPSYLLLKADGAELGRISGEQTEADFLAKLAELLGKAADPLMAAYRSALAANRLDEALKIENDILKANPSAAGRTALLILRARRELAEAFRAPGQKADVELAAGALERLLGLETGCELAYDVMAAQPHLEGLAEPRRRALLKAEQVRLEALVERRVFGPAAMRCADMRSPVEALGDAQDALGLKEQKQTLFLRMIAQLEAALAPLGPGRDRNLDDNHRFFLEAAGQNDKLDALYPRLSAAYPSDYVYAYRYAKNLHSRGKDVLALPWAQKAQALAYGANRIAVAKIHAQVLQALSRGPEAADLLKKEIEAGRPAFPAETVQLEDELAKLEAPR